MTTKISEKGIMINSNVTNFLYCEPILTLRHNRIHLTINHKIDSQYP